jgi:hypothetical protein
VTTRFGGFCYLLGLALELDMGEILWRACLPEGEALAHAVRAILADAADPAAALFGGVGRIAAVPAITAEQQEEIAAALLAALVAALPRRGLASVPGAAIALVDAGGERLLVATPDRSPFAVYAWPAGTAAALRAGLSAFVNAWPASAPLSGSPGLVSLDATGRLQPRPASPRPPLLPTGASAAATAVLAQVAGSLCQLFAARARLAAATPAELVERYLAVPARVVLAPGRMTVHIPADQVDLMLRRAALDRNPGWVPWLGREVAIVWEGDEVAAFEPP